jgi:hypothetical protein
MPTVDCYDHNLALEQTHFFQVGETPYYITQTISLQYNCVNVTYVNSPNGAIAAVCGPRTPHGV